VGEGNERDEVAALVAEFDAVVADLVLALDLFAVGDLGFVRPWRNPNADRLMIVGGSSR
jgi:hypothetical protein